jgi:N6-L-threonylcarbamoyladenine synthase
MHVIGETRDDAVGEAFDKAAKMMGFVYPGGPLIDQYARLGNPNAFQFPYTSIPGLDFSFSGIKTAFLYFLRDQKAVNSDFVEVNRNDICASLQKHLVKMLMQKVIQATEETGIKQVAIAGGVAANSGLRKSLQEHADRLGWTTFIPDFQYCTDNAAMIAMAAHHKFLQNKFSSLETAPLANLAIGD